MCDVKPIVTIVKKCYFDNVNGKKMAHEPKPTYSGFARELNTSIFSSLRLGSDWGCSQKERNRYF